MLEQSDPRIIVKVMVLLKFLGTVRISLNGKEYKMHSEIKCQEDRGLDFLHEIKNS